MMRSLTLDCLCYQNQLMYPHTVSTRFIPKYIHIVIIEFVVFHAILIFWIQVGEDFFCLLSMKRSKDLSVECLDKH